MHDVVALAEQLVAIPSVSGEEREVVEFVRDYLTSGGWRVRCQPVTPGRDNIWASRGRGVVTLSTHLDTVPPFIPPRRDGDRLYGRGSCDAKGLAAAMIWAANELAAQGEDRVDLLFVVGEEAGSDGAMSANELPATSSWIINGEPTEGRLASGAKGSLRATVATTGRAAHSAFPERGRSAIEAMVALLTDLRGVALPVDPEWGDTTVNVGTIEGGSAANVIPAECRAELLIRLVGNHEPVRAALDAWAADRAVLRWGAHVPVTRFHTVDGFPTGLVSFTTDAPLLHRWGRKAMLYGPGSIHYAHQPDEHVDIEHLRASVAGYQRLVRSLLNTGVP